MGGFAARGRRPRLRPFQKDCVLKLNKKHFRNIILKCCTKQSYIFFVRTSTKNIFEIVRFCRTAGKAREPEGFYFCWVLKLNKKHLHKYYFAML